MYIDVQIVEHHSWPICETSLAVAVAGPRMCITLESLRESGEGTHHIITSVVLVHQCSGHKLRFRSWRCVCVRVRAGSSKRFL